MNNKKWVCSENPNHVYDDVGDGFCPEGDGGVLILQESPVISDEPPPTPPIKGRDGLGILVFDFSGSMQDPLDPDSPNQITKIDAVANAFATTVAALTGGGSAIAKADRYYLALIGFSKDARLLDDKIFNLGDMGKNGYEETIEYWKNYISEQYRKMGGGLTNITAALQKAREIYDQALNNQLPGIEIGAQSILFLKVAPKEPVIVPNIRVFLYSDGIHNIGEPFRNVFEDAELVPNMQSTTNRKVNGLMTLFFGQPQKKGAKLMQDVAGYCAIHGEVGFITISELRHYRYLRDLIHVTTKASGFCLRCAKELEG